MYCSVYSCGSTSKVLPCVQDDGHSPTGSEDVDHERSSKNSISKSVAELKVESQEFDVLDHVSYVY